MPKRGQIKEKVFHLPAGINNRWVYSHQRYDFPPVDLDSHGRAPSEEPKNDEMKVGFDNRYDKSWPDWDYLGHVYRAIVFTNITEIIALKTRYNFWIDAATLHFVRDRTNRSEGDNAMNSGSAARYLYVLDESFRYSDQEPYGFDTPAHLHTALPAFSPDANEIFRYNDPALVIDIKNIVESWVNGNKPNWGFMFVGPDESYQHNNDCFVSYYKEIIATVVCHGYFG